MIAAAPTPPITDFDAFWDAYRDTLLGWSLNLGAAIAILILGLWIAGTLRKFLRRRIEAHPRIDRTLAIFLASLCYYVIVAFVLIAVLNRFGVQTTSLVAVLGAATLAVGLALQGTLSNVAAGVMVILLRPYQIGDWIEIGVNNGTVTDISLFTTELATPDNVHIVLPNSLCWGQPIRNYSKHKIRRCDLMFAVPANDKVDQAMAIIQNVAREEPRFLKSPEPPTVRLVNLAGAEVELQLRAWAAISDFWDVRFDTIRTVRETFETAGVAGPVRTK
jgi:small conductance mechanosensitive channel